MTKPNKPETNEPTSDAPTDAPVDATPETVTPAGFVRSLFGSGKKAGIVSVKDKGKVVATLNDVIVHVPVTREALEEVFKAYKHKVVGTDGTVHVLTGIDAAACAKWGHAAESIRGEMRQDAKDGVLKTDDTYRGMFAAFRNIGGGARGGRRAPALSKAEEAEATAKAMASENPLETYKKILREKGIALGL